MIKAFRLFGIIVYLHWSLLIFVAMIAIQEANRLSWWQGIVAGSILAIVLFSSVLFHEFAHSLVGRRYGVGFSQITLFVFGGAAKMDNEVRKPWSEFIMAAAGPAASFVLYLVCRAVAVAGVLIGGQDINPHIGVILSVIRQVGELNLLLAGFNMIPAFPMDGGRLLRATLWHFKGFKKATRWASYTGSIFGWTLIGCGALMCFGITVPVFGTGMVSGVWIAFMGWLINSMANRERASLGQ